MGWVVWGVGGNVGGQLWGLVVGMGGWLMWGISRGSLLSEYQSSSLVHFTQHTLYRQSSVGCSAHQRLILLLISSIHSTNILTFMVLKKYGFIRPFPSTYVVSQEKFFWQYGKIKHRKYCP